MIHWTKDFPKSEQPRALLRYLKAHSQFFDLPKIWPRLPGRPKLDWSVGYQRQLARLRDLYADKPCVIAAAGPSLADVDFEPLRKFPIITCNGAYKIFDDQGVTPDFFCMEDIEQVEKRRSEWSQVNAKYKLAALHNAYALPPDRQTIFFHTPRHSEGGYYWKDEPRLFSKDFASIVYLGGSIVYVMLQLAYHLGCKQIYLFGLDHSYKPVIEDLGVDVDKNRNVKITKDNIAIIERLHPRKGYFSIGDVIALPFVDEQERHFEIARQVLSASGREVINATRGTKLEVFPTGELR